VCVCMCVCVCVRERERERERVCVRMCVCVRMYVCLYVCTWLTGHSLALSTSGNTFKKILKRLNFLHEVSEKVIFEKFYTTSFSCAHLIGYGVASVSRIDKTIGLLCKSAL